MPMADVEVERCAAAYISAQPLTPRETQIAMLIFSGMKNTSIASHLNVSEATVRLHITNIHRKLGTANKVDLVLKAFAWWVHQDHGGARVDAVKKKVAQAVCQHLARGEALIQQVPPR